MTETIETPPPDPFSPARARVIIGGLCLAFFSFALWPRATASSGLFWGIVGWGTLAVACIAFLFIRRPDLALTPGIRRPHYVQLTVQGGVFAYWGWHWEAVYAEIPLILSQVAFAYLVELIVCWWRHGQWRIGFGPWPIVFSTNLFMWFHDDYFAAQYLMIALAYLSREFLRWERDGRSVHIFNPSAFGLCVISLVLIAFELPHLTWGAEISTTLGRPMYAYEWIFIMGVVVQLFFRVTLVTVSAVLSSWVVGTLYFGVTDTYMYVDTTIPIAVFLGMNLLVTDPASSPQSNGGKILFGTLYGLAIFFMYDVLRDMGRPAVGDDPGLSVSWMDKLLFLPFLNLLARPLDRLGRLISLPSWRWDETQTNRLHVGLWVVAFFLLLPSLNAHPGRTVAFWEPRCEQGVDRACENIAILLQSACQKDDAAACYFLGLRFEHGDGVPIDLARAGGAYQRACELEQGDGCRALGVLFTHGKGIAKDPQAAVGLYTRGCDYGSAESCVFAAEALARDLVEGGQQRAPAFARKACDGKQARGCFLYGQALRTGRGVTRSLPDAVTAYRAGCDQADPSSCTMLGTMVWMGHGTPADPAAARVILETACETRPKACQQLERLRLGAPTP